MPAVLLTVTLTAVAADPCYQHCGPDAMAGGQLAEQGLGQSQCPRDWGESKPPAEAPCRRRCRIDSLRCRCVCSLDRPSFALRWACSCEDWMPTQLSLYSLSLLRSSTKNHQKKRKMKKMMKMMRMQLARAAAAPPVKQLPHHFYHLCGSGVDCC
mmetsp:Transcript_126823/g.237031  ORF Transcript_126823/g.237031 Transcript_126823/m.237031 type:complete len:155 (+) Transcript_126823:177-641(+)